MSHSARRARSRTMTRRRAVQAGIGATIAAALPARIGFARQPATPQPGGALGEILPAIIEEAMAEMLVPSAVVLARTPADEFLGAFGTRMLGEDVPVTTADVYRIGSNTKTMTGTVLLQLVDEGLIALTDPVSAYWPETPNGDNIIVSQLLDMSSGLANYTVNLALNQVMDDDPARAWQPEELLEIGFSEPPHFPPGEGFHYSNTNTVLTGLIIEQLTGLPLEDAFQERLFQPLGLTSTALPAIDDATLPDPHPRGYLFGTNVSTIETTALPEADQAAAYAGDLLPNDVTGLNPSWGWAAGAAYASAPELATYAEALVQGDLLSAETHALRIASLKSPSGEPGSAEYGLGIARFGPMIGHDGSCPGYQSFMGHDPDAGTTLIVLTSIQSAPDGQMPANMIARAAIAQMYRT